MVGLCFFPKINPLQRSFYTQPNVKETKTLFLFKYLCRPLQIQQIYSEVCLDRRRVVWQVAVLYSKQHCADESQDTEMALSGPELSPVSVAQGSLM